MVADRELRNIVGEKTFILAIAIQVFVAAFSSFLVVGLATLFDPTAAGSDGGVAVALEGNEDLRELLEERGVEVLLVSGPDRGQQLMEQDRVHAFVQVERVEPNATDPVAVHMVVPEGRFRTPVTVVVLQDTLKAYEQELREARGDRLEHAPLEVTVEETTSSYYEFVYTLLVPLLLFLPAFLAGALVADSLTEELQRGNLPLLLVTRLDIADVADGKVLANAVLSPALGLAWILLLEVNGIPVANVVWLLLQVAGTAVLFGVAATLVALLTRERNKAQVAYTSLLLVLLLASNLLPESPLGAAARLAAGSATPLTVATAAGTAALGVASLLVLRALLQRYRVPLLEGPQAASKGT